MDRKAKSESMKSRQLVTIIAETGFVKIINGEIKRNTSIKIKLICSIF